MRKIVLIALLAVMLSGCGSPELKAKPTKTKKPHKTPTATLVIPATKVPITSVFRGTRIWCFTTPCR